MKTPIQKRKSASFASRSLALLSLFVAIELLLALTPLGYLPLGPIRATTIHIPVILGGIFMGPSFGAFLGFLFGATSFLTNTIFPMPTSFIFTPFYPLPGQESGNLWSLAVCFLPRICIGLIAGFLGRTLIERNRKNPKKEALSLILTGVVSSLSSTVLVVLGILLFFSTDYQTANPKAAGNVVSFLLGTLLGINGLLEALTAGLLVLLLGKALLKITSQRGSFRS